MEGRQPPNMNEDEYAKQQKLDDKYLKEENKSPQSKMKRSNNP